MKVKLFIAITLLFSSGLFADNKDFTNIKDDIDVELFTKTNSQTITQGQYVNVQSQNCVLIINNTDKEHNFKLFIRLVIEKNGDKSDTKYINVKPHEMYIKKCFVEEIKKKIYTAGDLDIFSVTEISGDKFQSNYSHSVLHVLPNERGNL